MTKRTPNGRTITCLQIAESFRDEAKRLRNLHAVQRAIDGRVKTDMFRKRARRREQSAQFWTISAFESASQR